MHKGFSEVFEGELPEAAYNCPGRVNLIGEHIDYNGGLVLPAAISLGITAHIRRNASMEMRLWSDHSSEVETLSLEQLSVRRGHWTDYAIGVLLKLRHDGLALEGCDVHFSSTLPQGAGLSSSAAIEVLCYFMFSHFLTGITPDRVQLSKDCQQIENTHIGVNCGIMDQFAVTLGMKNHALLLNCATLEYKPVPIVLQGYSLLIINSHAARTLASSAYNQRRIECDQALLLLQGQKDIGQLVDASELDIQTIIDPVLQKRARHVVTEQLRVAEAVTALDAGDLPRFGQLLNASHASLRDDYEVSSAELDHIVNLAQRHPGCLGARLTGAGFGGCCIALMREDAIPSFQTQLEGSYCPQFDRPVSFHACKISEGVHGLTI